MTASVGSIQNFASFICASFAPVVTGFIVDTTHSFQLALVICGCVTALGALAYIFWFGSQLAIRVTTKS